MGNIKCGDSDDSTCVSACDSPVLSCKDPREERLYEMDFTDILKPGELIVSVDSTMTFRSGLVLDTNPAAMIPTSPTFAGAIVSQLIIGGKAGATYHWVSTVVTDLGETYVLGADLPVVVK